MATNKIKIFFPEELKSDPECINKFMAEHDVPANGIVVKDNFIVVNYFDKSVGINSFDHVAELSRELAGHQTNIRDWTLELRWHEQFTPENDKRPDGERKNPSPTEANVNVAQFRKRIEDEKKRIEFKMEMIKQFESGDFVI